MTRRFGAIKTHKILVEERLGLTHKRPSYRPTGTHPSPRSVLVRRSNNRSTSLSSTSRPTLSTHWSLTGNTASPHWVETRGRSWLVQRPPCRSTATRKGSMLWVLIPILKHDLAFLVTNKMTAVLVTPESGLVLEGLLMTSTRVVTKLHIGQIMESNTSKPWVTSWCSDKENRNNCSKRFKSCRMLLLSINILQGMENFIFFIWKLVFGLLDGWKVFLLVTVFTLDYYKNITSSSW